MKLLNSLILFTVLMFSACLSQGKSPVQMADPHASPATVKLLSKMKELTKQGIMIGHQDDMAYGIGWIAPNGQSDIYKVCSDFPAVFGWDLGHIETGAKYNLDSVPFADMTKYALDVHSRGGINTFSWHLNNPLTGGSAWDVSSDAVVKSILPGGKKNAEFNTWLDKVAVFFSGLKDANGNLIPVIFRPFHEQTGNWFWWGNSHCSPEEFRQIWAYTVRYLSDTKHIHNLIYAFSTAGSFGNIDEYSARYPGNEYVDIAGFDLYQDANQANAEFTNLLRQKLGVLNEFTKANDKLAALTEIGYEQIPEPKWWTGVFYPAVKELSVSYALFWRNAANRPNHFYVPYPGQKSAEDFNVFYNLSETLFLKDLVKLNIYK